MAKYRRYGTCAHCRLAYRPMASRGLCTRCHQHWGCYTTGGRAKPLDPEERSFRREVFEGYPKVQISAAQRREDAQFLISNGASVASAAMQLGLSESRLQALLASC